MEERINNILADDINKAIEKREAQIKKEEPKKEVPTISLDDEVREDRFFDDFFDD